MTVPSSPECPSAMNDQDKTQEQLIAELAELRKRLSAMEPGAGGQPAPASSRWHFLVANTPVFILVLDRDHRIRHINHTEPGESPDDVVGLSPYDYCLPEYHDAVREHIKRVFRTGEPASYEAEAVRPNHDRVWYQAHLGPILDSGEIVAVSLVAENVTARKQAAYERDQAERALRESEQRFRKVFEEGPLGIALLGTKLDVQQVNGPLCDLLGYSKEELVALGVRAISHPDDWEQDSHMVSRLLRGDIPHYTIDKRYVCKSGEVLWGQLTVSLMRDDDGAPATLIGMVQDITERKTVERALRRAHEELERQAEEELRQSHEELQAIYDRMVDGLLVTDVETLRFVRANASICQMLGYSETELLSLTVGDIHPPDALPHIIQTIRAAEELNEPPTGSLPVLRKDGSVFYAEVIGNFLVYHGRPCSMAIFRDITERKQAQEALERQRRTLFHVLQASDHERQVIAYDIHDGLAQQLAAAIMQFQTYDGLARHDPAHAKTAYDAGVQMMRRAHAEARRLISGVRPPILDESGIAAAIAHLVYEHSVPTGPRVEFHSGLRIGRLVKVLENAIYRIAQEALGNALQHSGSEKVKVTLIQDKDDLRLEVRDWGVGFEPESVGENRFGLEGIQERTRLLGGTCSIESEPGKGTRIRVTLPILEQE